MEGAAHGTIRGAPLVAGVRLSRPADPLAAMIGPSERIEPIYAAVGLAVVLHVVMLASAVASGLLRDVRLAVEDDRARLHEYFWREYEVDLKPPEAPKHEDPPPPPPEPPPPAPAPMIKAPPKEEDDPYKNIPAAPAHAAKVLVRDDPDEVKDLTGNTVVTGDGNATYGQLSTNGKGDTPTMARNTSLNGVPGGRGSVNAPPPPPPPGPDLSRPMRLSGGASCHNFPPEADADQVDQAVAVVQVTLRPDGTVSSVSVLNDPGHGFGRAARLCALNTLRFSPALDRAGNPIVSSAPVTVRFNR